jgi:hypothetical protein
MGTLPMNLARALNAKLVPEKAIINGPGSGGKLEPWQEAAENRSRGEHDSRSAANRVRQDQSRSRHHRTTGNPR